MSFSPTNVKRVLAVDPTWCGFGYAILEGPKLLVDWGLKEAREARHAKNVRQVAELLKRYEPQVLVVEDVISGRRKDRTKDLIIDFAEIARARGMEAVFIRRTVVRKTIAVDSDGWHDDIAALVARQFPELAHRLPPRRKPWKHEDGRIRIFGSIALALTYYASKKRDDHR